jgi:hypothetical protein
MPGFMDNQIAPVNQMPLGWPEDTVSSIQGKDKDE